MLASFGGSSKKASGNMMTARMGDIILAFLVTALSHSLLFRSAACGPIIREPSNLFASIQNA